MGTVEYLGCYLALLSRCDNLSMRTKIDLYTGGLGQPLVVDVELQHPVDLQQAMSLVRAYEQSQVEASTINSSAAPKSCTHRTTTLISAVGSSALLQDDKPDRTCSAFAA